MIGRFSRTSGQPTKAAAITTMSTSTMAPPIIMCIGFTPLSYGSIVASLMYQREA
jgi:hypothetical protein